MACPLSVSIWLYAVDTMMAVACGYALFAEIAKNYFEN